MSFKSSHNLKFETRPWGRYPQIQEYKIGTCQGQWFHDPKKGYHILSFLNLEPGNGHLQDVFDWFENSAKRDKCPLVLMEFENTSFKFHCINKRGFQPVPKSDNLIKYL